MQADQLLALDAKHLWHPCSQMKDYEDFKPLIIKKAQAAWIELSDGRKIIDAISSWWCKSLGHNHPRLKQALYQQAEQFEHIILANTTHEIIVKLSQELATLAPGLNKVFYASDGSCAVEIALKMSLHSRFIKGEKQRGGFIALKNGYHGETLGALSMSDVGLYREPYNSVLLKPHFIQAPYVNGTADPLWNDCAAVWPAIEADLAPYADNTTAIILEPILQGAGGMLIYSQDFLRRLGQWAKAHDIHLIADEILTGVGRTGTMLACEHANLKPDFICLSKSLTSGWLPLSAVITHDQIYQIFYDDYASGKAFLHSHTFSGNALAARLAYETLQIIKEERLCTRANFLSQQMVRQMTEIAETTRRITHVRSIGAMVAGDLVTDNPKRRLGYEVYQQAVKLGALLRPLGNTIYWLPPLNIDLETLSVLHKITEQAINAVTR